MNAIVSGVQLQSRIISALILREFGSRHGGGGVGTLWILLEPIFMTMIVIGIHFSGTGWVLKGIPIVVFLLTGYVPHLMFRHGGLAGVIALNADSGLLYHRQIHYVDLVLARWGLEVVTVVIAFILVYLGFAGLGMMGPPRDPPLIFAAWALHIWFAIDGCFLFTGLCIVFPIVRRLFMPLSLAMLPAYAAFFMMSWLPPAARNFLLLFPPADATELMRYGYFGPSQATYFNIPYTIGCLIVLTLVSILIMDWGRKHLEV